MKTKHTPGLFAAAPDMLELLQKMVEDGEAGMMDEFPPDALISIPIRNVLDRGSRFLLTGGSRRR